MSCRGGWSDGGSRREDFCQCFTNGLTAADYFCFQQANGGIELPGFDRGLLFRIGLYGQVVIHSIYQTGKTRQARRVRDTGAAEEHHLPVFVGLQQAFGNVGAICNELHANLSLEHVRHLVVQMLLSPHNSAVRASHAGSLDARFKGAAHGVFTASAGVVTTVRLIDR